MNRIKEIKDILNRANEAYRLGDEIMPDETYEEYLDELREISPNDEYFGEIGIELIDEERKEKLPVQLWSMNKMKTMLEVFKWSKNKGIPLDTLLTITPKYDGISLCVIERSIQSWTRGNGTVGQRSHDHFRHVNTNQLSGDIITWGEAIMPREVFDKNHSYAKNPRNLVAGKFNDKTPNPEVLKDCEYVRYGMETDEFDFETKSEVLDYLNETQKTIVPYENIEIKDLTEEYLKELFIKWSSQYEIDGVILEVNDLKLQKELGRERNNNPVFARAFKGDFEEVKESKVVSITIQVSKRGYLKPVVNIEPIELDGVTVTNPTGYNFRFIKEMGIGIGSIVKVKRSGMVIPKIIKTVKRVEFEMPDIGVPIKWNDTGVELVATEMTPIQKRKQIESFFNILQVDNVGEGVIKQIFESGFDTLPKILSMSQKDFQTIDRFGVKKSEKTFNSIQSKLQNITLSKLQHGSGCFENLGSKKLLLLEDMDMNSSVQDIIKIDGFSDISAESYLNGLESYKDFYEEIKDYISVIKTPKKEVVDSKLEGMSFVFSGFRDNEMKERVSELGGEMKSGISKKVTHLVVRDKNSGTSKVEKAKDLGIEIIEIEELKTIIN